MAAPRPPAVAFDAVILGAGPAGLTTALAMRQWAPLSVLVVDAGRPGRPRVGETVPPGLLVALDRLGLGARFRAGGHVPCPGSASVWGHDRVRHNDFVLDPAGPAWRLDRPRFDRLLAAAAEESGATLRWRTRFDGVVTDGRGALPHRLRLRPSDGDAYVARARCVIDATGPGAPFARAVGARRRVDDRLFAVVRLGPAAAGTATLQTLVEAVPAGWWYGARTPGDGAVVMFVTDRAGLRRLRAGGPQAFDDALSETCLVRSVVTTSPAAGFRRLLLPVYSSALDRRAGEGWMAVGDAAASYDPIAGQGLYKAVTDAIDAADQARALLDGGSSLGGFAPSPDPAVMQYRRARAHVYGLERRFPDSTFWTVRRERATRALEGESRYGRPGPAAAVAPFVWRVDVS
jgi:flavin-dependent dehydrogenase